MKNTIKIIFLGDIMGKLGREALKEELPKLKKRYKPDLTLANCENLAHGHGITEKTISEMTDAGVDYFTSGNHVFNKPQGFEVLNQPDPLVIRPANYKGKMAGVGDKLIKIGENQLLMINLIGRVFIDEPTGNPFLAIDRILKKYKKENLSGILVDFHAEATSEKIGMRHYLNGRISALWGTHTHVQTADEQITPKGTAYITDVGMVGAADGIIGVDKKSIIESFLKSSDKPTGIKIMDEGPAIINGIYLEIDALTTKTKKIERINYIKET